MNVSVRMMSHRVFGTLIKTFKEIPPDDPYWDQFPWHPWAGNGDEVSVPAAMQPLKDFVLAIYEGLNYEFEIYGFKMSFWGIMMFTVVASLLIMVFREVVLD